MAGPPCAPLTQGHSALSCRQALSSTLGTDLCQQQGTAVQCLLFETLKQQNTDKKHKKQNQNETVLVNI